MADQRDELSELESELRTLVPTAARLDRDRIMYSAGQSAQASASQRAVWMWRVAAALLLAATLVQSVRMQYLPTRIVDRMVYQTSPIVQPLPREQIPGSVRQKSSIAVAAGSMKTSMGISPDSWLGQRNLALVAGVDAIAIPSSSATAAQTSPTMGQLRDALLRDARLSGTGNDSTSESNSKRELEL